MQDLERAREIYKAALKLLPHKRFTFAKVWTQFAEFEVRQLQLDAARKIMGTAIGMAPKEKVSTGFHSQSFDFILMCCFSALQRLY